MPKKPIKCQATCKEIITNFSEHMYKVYRIKCTNNSTTNYKEIAKKSIRTHNVRSPH
jgi:hypothetical protein